MSSAFANRAARRRGIVFTVLLVVTVLMMAFSSNPGVRDLQSGVGYAFRPIQGALDSVAGGIASVATAITEIDRLRTDNAQLRDENERLATENTQVDEIRRENDLLTGLLQLQAGFNHKTAAAAVIGRDSLELRRAETPPPGLRGVYPGIVEEALIGQAEMQRRADIDPGQPLDAHREMLVGVRPVDHPPPIAARSA
jgi:cell shape-determining protein MreC